MAATSPASAWAVGVTVSGGALMVHWNGAAWRQVAIPSPPRSGLSGVAAASARSTWAVGSYCASRCGTDLPVSDTLIFHWNGTAWARVPGRSPGQLTAVAAVSARSAWAVGFDGLKALILRWNGPGWARVPSPGAGCSHGCELDGVSAASPAEAWAVGLASPAARAGKTLIEHWNGVAWQDVPSPDGLGGYAAGLSAVAAASPRDAWAVGDSSPRGTGCACAPLIVHWNGAAWRQVTVTATAGLFPGGVAALSARSAWAAGWTMGGQTAIFGWDGTRWRRVPSPSPGGRSGSELHGVAANSADEAWAVGCARCFGPGSTTLILRWNGTAWT
ncbi:MAG TPA: hypothetical protein VLX31_14555 [Streptosporangiaceae bacterium]|nr:hypothetical protein [Streptosporangiaceae bacterium]